MASGDGYDDRSVDESLDKFDFERVDGDRLLVLNVTRDCCD